MYFETGGADLSSPAPINPPQEPPQSRSPPTQDVTPVVEAYDEGDRAGTPQQAIDEDEALARRLMQEEVDQQSVSGNDGVRTPIAARNDVLVHPDVDYDVPYRYSSRGRGIMC